MVNHLGYNFSKRSVPKTDLCKKPQFISPAPVKISSSDTQKKINWESRILTVWKPLSIPLKIKSVSCTGQELVEKFARKPDWYS